MEATMRIPADIFEEMAGMKEVSVANDDDNVNAEKKITPFNHERLKEASVPFISFSKKKLVKSFEKIAKTLLKLQKAQAPNLKKSKKPSKIFVKITRVLSKNESEGKKASKLSISDFSPAKLAWKAIKFAVKILFKLSKWVFSLGKNTFTSILKVMGKLAKKLFVKIIKPIAKLIGGVLKKVISWAFKQCGKVATSIWNIVKRLFFKGKPAPQVFDGEPKPESMDQPHNKKGKKSMKLKVKAPKKKENAIMKYFKKGMKKIFKVSGKILKKIFGKIIKKIIKTLVKLVVKFFAMQAIGSLLPGIGNAIAFGAFMVTAVTTVMGIIDFIEEVSNDVKSAASEINESEEEDEEEDDIENEESIDLNGMSIAEIHSYMLEMEEANNTSSMEYIQAKQQYLNLLANDYENAGDIEGAQIIRAAMKSGSLDGTNVTIGTDANPISTLNIADLQKKLMLYRKKVVEQKYKVKKTNVLDESEIKILLTGEEDGGPMWMSIWREFIWFVKGKLYDRLEIDQYQNICSEVMTPHIRPHTYFFDGRSKWVVETQDQRNERVEKGRSKILETQNDTYKKPNLTDFTQPMKFSKVIDVVNDYKVNFNETTGEYQNAKQKEVEAQEIKHDKCIDILEVLWAQRGWRHNLKYARYKP